MRILVASDTPLDSVRAHTINVLKTAGGFQRLGHDIIVCARSPQSQDPTAALASFGEASLPCCLAGPEVPTAEQDNGSGFANWAVRIANELRPDIVYARHLHTAIAACELGFKTILETHAYAGDTNPALLAALRATRARDLSISTISHRLAEYYIGQGAHPQRVHIVPDGVDTALFENTDEPIESPLSGHGPHAVYAGNLQDHKGIADILDAASRLPAIQFHLVGGLDADIEQARHIVEHRELTNVTIHGRVPHTQVAPYLWNADVLLLPPSAREPSKDWTSPLKLGEYLASSSPIVCTDIPALRDWIHTDLVEWAEPDNGASLADAISRTLSQSDTVLADRYCRSIELARKLSYPSRAQTMLHASMGAQDQVLRVAA